MADVIYRYISKNMVNTFPRSLICTIISYINESGQLIRSTPSAPCIFLFTNPTWQGCYGTKMSVSKFLTRETACQDIDSLYQLLWPQTSHQAATKGDEQQEHLKSLAKRTASSHSSLSTDHILSVHCKGCYWRISLNLPFSSPLPFLSLSVWWLLDSKPACKDLFIYFWYLRCSGRHLFAG